MSKYTKEKRIEISKLISKYLKQSITVKRPLYHSEIVDLLLKNHGIDLDESMISWYLRRNIVKK